MTTSKFLRCNLCWRNPREVYTPGVTNATPPVCVCLTAHRRIREIACVGGCYVGVRVLRDTLRR